MPTGRSPDGLVKAGCSVGGRRFFTPRARCPANVAERNKEDGTRTVGEIATIFVMTTSIGVSYGSDFA